MGAKKAKTAHGREKGSKDACPNCESDLSVVMYAGFGEKQGFFWECTGKSCDYLRRTGT